MWKVTVCRHFNIVRSGEVNRSKHALLISEIKDCMLNVVLVLLIFLIFTTPLATLWQILVDNNVELLHGWDLVESLLEIVSMIVTF